MKRFYFILSLLICFSIGHVWGDEVYVELCTSWSKILAYATAYTQDYSINDLNEGTTTMTLGVQGVYRASNANTYFQMNKKTGYFKNTTKLPGKITKIETTWSAAKGATKCYFASNAQATSSDATVTVTAATSVTYTPNSDADYYFFNIDVSTGSGSAQMTSCKVYYTTAGSSTPPTACDIPTFSPAAGSYEGTQSVTISCSTSGATIYYTTDGSTPTASSSVYSSAISVSKTTTIKALAVKNDLENSEVATAAYTITEGPDVTLDFTDNTDWGFPTSKIVDEGSYTKGTYTVKVAGSTGNGYNFTTSKTLLLGKSGAYLILPTFDRPLEKITCPGVSGASGSVTWNIAKGTEYVSTAVTGCTIDKTFEISNPEANVAYTIRVTNANNLQISKIKIYLGEAEAVAKPSISGNQEFLNSTTVTLDCSTSGADIYYTLDESDPKTSNTKSKYSEPFALEATKTVKAVAKVGGDWSAVAEKTFTKVTPMSVADAKTAIESAPGKVLTNKYVKGIISQIDAFSSPYIQYWISDDGTKTGQFEVYKGKGLNNTDFTAVTDLCVGDEVTIFGTIKWFSSGSVYEFDKDNYIVAIKPIARLSWSAESYDADLSGKNTFPTLTKPNGITVSYSSSDATKAEIDASGAIALKAEGSTTITASFAGNATYRANSASYTLNISNTVVRGTITYNVDGGSEVAAQADQTTLPNPLPSTTKAGKNFGGWFTDSQKTIAAVAGASIDGDITLYAKWLDPYTVTEALTMIDALDDNGETADVYVSGIVCTAPTSLISGGYLTYYISVDGTETSRLQVYKGKGVNNAAFTSKDDVQVDDQVVVFGPLKKYKTNSNVTPEINTGNYLYSLHRDEVAVTGVSLPETATVRVDKTTTLTATIAPANATDKVVTWKSSNTNIATVANGVVTGVATGTITITVTTHDGNKTATCEVTVAEAVTFTNSGYEWQHVTSADQLVAGKYYVMASDVKGKVASRTITSGYLGVESATFADGVIAYNGFGLDKTADNSGAAVFQLGASSTEWTLTEVLGDETGLLGGATTQNATWGTGTTTWPISIDTDGNAIIGSSSENRFLYNATSPRFKPYSSATSASMLLPQLYVWAEKTLKLRYDANGGEDAPTATIAQNGKATVTNAKPTQEGKIFDKWNTQANGQGTSYVAGDEVTLTDNDVTLYALWREPGTYTVSYNANGGSLIEGKDALDAEPVTEGESYSVKGNDVYEKEGFLFGGWEYDGKVYAKGESLTIPDGDVEFVAKWNELHTTDFVLVTDAAQLLDGDKVYIVAAGYNVAMTTQNEGNYRDYLEIVKSNGHIVVADDEPVELTLGKEDGKFTFHDGTGYLCATSSTKNYLGTQTELTDNGKWTIEISTNDKGVTSASIIAQGTNKHNDLKWNNSTPRFSCYESGQQPVAIYKKLNTLRAVSAGAIGTFCPKQDVAYLSGASFFTISHVEMHAGDPYKVFFDEIGENENLQAGHSYVFIADGTEIKGVKTGTQLTSNSAQDYNDGLIGWVVDYNLHVSDEDYAANKYYMIYGGQIHRCGIGWFQVPAERAYIDMAQVSKNYVAPAPGRRRVSLSNPDVHQVATDVNNLVDDNKVIKVIINDQMVIIRNGRMYDTTGRIIE